MTSKSIKLLTKELETEIEKNKNLEQGVENLNKAYKQINQKYCDEMERRQSIENDYDIVRKNKEKLTAEISSLVEKIEARDSIIDDLKTLIDWYKDEKPSKYKKSFVWGFFSIEKNH